MRELPTGTGAAEARPSDASHRPGAHVRERDILLATKLRVPRSRPDVLVRPRLLDRVGEVAALEERTEGWVTGLQLAALSLRAGSDPADLIRGFSGGHRYVLDYLTGEVLERQPADVRRFLLDTSILERLSGPLCDAVTGRSDGQQMLEGLERANLFLVALDEQRRWYRYHRLFADLLRVRLQRQEGGAERVAELHRSAAAWCVDRGLIDDAVRHAMAAGEARWAARIVEHRVDEAQGLVHGYSVAIGWGAGILAAAALLTTIMINAGRPPRRGDAARSTGEGTPRLRRHRTAIAADSQRHATGGWVRICASASV